MKTWRTMIVDDLLPGDVFEFKLDPSHTLYGLRKTSELIDNLYENTYRAPFLVIGTAWCTHREFSKDYTFLFVLPLTPAIPGWLCARKTHEVTVLK